MQRKDTSRGFWDEPWEHKALVEVSSMGLLCGCVQMGSLEPQAGSPAVLLHGWVQAAGQPQVSLGLGSSIRHTDQR